MEILKKETKPNPQIKKEKNIKRTKRFFAIFIFIIEIMWESVNVGKYTFINDYIGNNKKGKYLSKC